MKNTIVIAPDSFKGTMSAIEVCEIIRREFLNADSSLEVKCVPIADGGEGTVDALLFNGGERVTVTAKDPFFNNIDSFFGILPDGTAVIEMAATSGLPLVEENKNPLLATTYGTGQLIKSALDRGCKKILIGIGGSATNDGGIGCAATLGARFLDKDGNSVQLCGGGMKDIEVIDLNGVDVRLKNAEIKVLCDVVSPLYGENGAAYIFAPQKGADPEMVKELDGGLKHLAEVTAKTIGADNSLKEGAGAAGGLGFGLVSFLGAELVKGAPAVLKTMGFEEIASKAQLVITGEGCMDSQSLLGKAPAQVAALSGDTPVIAIVGMSRVNDLSGSKIQKIYPTDCGGRTFEQIKKECRKTLAAAAKTAADEWLANKIINE